MEKVLKRKLIKKEDELTLIPKTEKYIEYMLSVILKIPRVEKFSIGNEYKNSMNILSRKVKDEKLYKLLEKIVYSNSGLKGLPIGNYTLQIFANIYLNEVDQYIKQELKVQQYFRYMDDFVLFTRTKLEAKEENMNECFLFVKRISNIEYKFIINRKEKAIARFNGILQNKAKITFYAYDNLADKLYQKEPKELLVRGKIRENRLCQVKCVIFFESLKFL